jgi:uncharacterized membrane protein
MRTYTGRIDAQGNPVKPSHKERRWNGMEILSFLALVIWGGAGLFFTIQHISPAVVAQWPISDGLRQFVDLCLQYGDPVLILIASINTHLHAVRQWSAAIARRWGAIVIVIAFAIESCGTTTGIPFGPYHYTENFGPMLGVIPLTIPFAWHVVVTNALFLVRAISPYVSRILEAVFVGLVCTAYDLVLEPFATQVKHYWTWTEGSVPPLNYIAWFGISAVLVLIFAPTASNRYRFDLRPWLILGLTLAIFIAGEF